MNPTIQQVHVNKPLTDFSLMMLQKDGFVADQVFKTKMVDNKTDLYFTYNRGDFNTASYSLRAPGTELQNADYGISTATFATEVKGLKRDIPNQIINNADAA